MKARIAFTLLLLFVGCTWETVAAQSTWTAETEKGMQAEITNVEAVYLRYTSDGTRVETGRDSAGNPLYKHRGAKFEYLRATTLPLRPGDGFGFRLKLPRIDEDDAIVFALKTELPFPVRGQRVVEWTMRYESKDSDAFHFVFWKFRPENPHYQVPGTWVHKVYSKTRLLTSQTFILTPP